jgi:hypothetical protein
MTTRTRGNGNGRPKLDVRKKQFMEQMTTDSEEEDLSFVDTADELDEEFDAELLLAEDELLNESKGPKPTASRVILEVDGVLETSIKRSKSVTIC